MCYTYEKSVGGNKTAYRLHTYTAQKVTVGLDLGPDGRVQGFVGRYYRDKTSSGFRELRSPLDREALVRMLVDLHKPSRRAEIALVRDQLIWAVLLRIEQLQVFPVTVHKLEIQRPEWMYQLSVDARIDPSELSQGSTIGPWDLSYRIQGQFDPDVHYRDSFWPQISISIRVDDTDTPIQYEYKIEGM